MNDEYLPVHVWSIDEPVVIEEYFRKSDGTNDSQIAYLTIGTIIDKFGNRVAGGRQEDWSEASPGIETRRVGKLLHVRIHPQACPVEIKVSETDAYNSNDYPQDDSYYRKTYLIRIVPKQPPKPKNVFQRLLSMIWKR
jgi:hypothetical protein